MWQMIKERIKPKFGSDYTFGDLVFDICMGLLIIGICIIAWRFDLIFME